MKTLLTTFNSAVMIVSFASANTQALEEPPPNIIFIMADDVGYNDLAANGQRLFPTPHTDRLADQGVRLTAAYSPASVCTPTRYAVMTGTDPFRRLITSHVLFNAEPMVIRPDEPTVASLLQEAGYATGVIGKWHLGLGDTLPRDINNPGRGPNEIGFDYSFLVPDGHNMFPRYYHENGLVVGGTEEPFESKLIVQKRVGLSLLQHNRVGHWPDRRPDNQIGVTLADRVDAFIEDHANQPFFLYYATCSIHSPLTPDPQFVGKSGIGPFGDFVMEYDWAVGRVMAKLDELGIAGNTLLIVTSDNGGLSNHEINLAGVSLPASVHRTAHPWRSEKGSMYEGGHRVPFLARWPRHIPRGSVSDTFLSLVDLTATAAKLAGVALPENAALDSFDMLPALKGETSPRSYVVTGTRGMEAVSIRQDDWKLITKASGSDAELYHLGNDPQEMNNLLAQQPDEAGRLQALLDHYFLQGHSRPEASASGKTMQEILAELEARNAKTQSVIEEMIRIPEVPLVPFRNEESAVLQADHGAEGVFAAGVKLFSDRRHVLLDLPNELDGKTFLRAPIGGASYQCTEAGMVWVVTPTAKRNPDSLELQLLDNGFEKTDLPEFYLFNRNDANLCSVFQKHLEAGESLLIGKWGVVVF